jgi:sterol desaturase/sphingolipid hydroxylase (fatty acid hydroxylase superfamily)
MLAMFPMVMMGFPAELIIFGSLVVLAYQTWLHTELIGNLGVLEKWLNTPANHRVHHGCDKPYLDKNFGGILIVWDRLFGSYQPELYTPRYGLDKDFDSVNPFIVWFSEFPLFFSDLFRSKSMYEVWMRFFARPEWQPNADKKASPDMRGQL